MTLEEFLGAVPVERMPPLAPRDGGSTLKRLHSFTPIYNNTLAEIGTYSLHAGLYHAEPILDAAARLGPWGRLLVIAVASSGESVGWGHSTMLYILPNHRGHAIGVEMLVQLFLFHGEDAWRKRQRQLTDNGRAMFCRAYDELKRRGHIS